jgi:hypothetical protein
MDGNDAKYDGPKLLPRGTPKWVLWSSGVTIGVLVPILTLLLPPVNEYVKSISDTRAQRVRLEAEIESSKARNESTALSAVLAMTDTLRTALAAADSKNRDLSDQLEACNKRKR